MHLAIPVTDAMLDDADSKTSTMRYLPHDRLSPRTRGS
jgi:hypothetical protein